MLKWLKRFTCKHKRQVPYAAYYETDKNGHKHLKHQWKCKDCGEII